MCLYILDISPLSGKCCRYFLPGCTLSFSSLKNVVPTAKVFNFNEVQFIHFSSMDHAFPVISKNSSPHPGWKRSSLMFSYKRLMALCFTFKSMIRFELIFVSCVKFGLRFIYLPVDSNCPSTVCPIGYPSSMELIFIFVKNQLGNFVWSISGFTLQSAPLT